VDDCGVAVEAGRGTFGKKEVSRRESVAAACGKALGKGVSSGREANHPRGDPQAVDGTTCSENVEETTGHVRRPAYLRISPVRFARLFDALSLSRASRSRRARGFLSRSSTGLTGVESFP